MINFIINATTLNVFQQKHMRFAFNLFLNVFSTNFENSVLAFGKYTANTRCCSIKGRSVHRFWKMKMESCVKAMKKDSQFGTHRLLFC